MAVATAIVGSAVIGGVATAHGASSASSAARAGARDAADATVQATQLQVGELRRQFDEQMRMLAPMIQSQYGAGSAFAQLLGFDGYNAETGEFAGGGPPRAGEDGFVDPNLDPRRMGGASAQDTEFGQQAFGNTLAGATPEQDLAIRRAAETGLYGGVDQDSMVQQARNRRVSGATPGEDAAVQNVLGNRTAGADPSQDLYAQRVAGNPLAAPTMAEDERFQFARDTAVVGEDFRTSPGYEFSVEQGQREVDRKNSAGGNYGGRALMEATRRMQGTADQEYYNWVNARQGDLSRQDAAAGSYQQRQMGDVARGDVATESYLGRQVTDAGRMDQATMNYLQRLGMDVGREDAGVMDARRREEMDLGRGDAALENYFGRRGGDLTRQDQSILNNQGLQQYDMQRRDQAYYNYLGQVGGASGIGSGVGQAVGASAQAGQGIANAYGNQGNQLSSIHSQLGTDRANIALGRSANINNAVQGGIQNYLFADQAGIL